MATIEGDNAQGKLKRMQQLRLRRRTSHTPYQPGPGDASSIQELMYDKTFLRAGSLLLRTRAEKSRLEVTRPAAMFALTLPSVG